MIEIVVADRAHAGRWTCIAENDAGSKEIEIALDVWSKLNIVEISYKLQLLQASKFIRTIQSKTWTRL